MDTCIVCLESNVDIFTGINSKSHEWKQYNIQRIIEKHLWWWYMGKTSKKSTQWICRLCWHEISSFHNFYLRVENTHKEYASKTHNFKIDPGVGSGVFNAKLEEGLCNEELPSIKEEITVFDIVTTHIEDFEPPLDKSRKRVRRKKGNIDYAELEDELPIAQLIKSENDSTIKTEINDAMDLDSGEDNWEPNLIESNDTDDNSGCDIKSTTDDDIPNKKLNNSKKQSKTKKRRKSKKQPETLEQAENRKKQDEFIAESKFDLICNLCNISLPCFENLVTHYRIEHKTRGYAVCCTKKFFQRSYLVDHINVHKDPNFFTCQYCDKVLTSRVCLEAHIERVHNSTQRITDKQQPNYKCDDCDKTFLKKNSYDRHLLFHIPEEERKFQCTECDKKFPTEYILRQHIARTHKKKYHKVCDICGKLLRNRFTFVRHMTEHTGTPQAKVPCDICGAQLSTIYRLNRHKKVLHSEENSKSVKCPYCSKVSPSLNAHRAHIYVHNLPRKHACHLCDKKFKRPVELKEHLSIHTGIPLYTCPHCAKPFKSSANMHKHRKQAHRAEWEEGRLKKMAAFPQMKCLQNIESSHSNSTTQDSTIIERSAGFGPPGLSLYLNGSFF